MKCTVCGTETLEAHDFCMGCGNALAKRQPASGAETQQTGASGVHEDVVDRVFDRMRQEKQCDSYRQAAAYYADEMNRYKSTITVCMVSAVVIALTSLPPALLWTSVIGRDNDAAALVFLVGLVVSVLLVSASVPFGVAAIGHWMKGHGFFFIGGWILMVVLFAFVAMIAFCIGPFYAAHLFSAMKKARILAEQNQRLAVECAQAMV